MSVVVQLGQRALENANVRGNELCEAMERAARPQLLWLHYLLGHRDTGTARCLIEGVESAIREGAACLILGLARPALNSLRMQIDLTLSWLYFKDHPVEWEQIQQTGENFKLKKELLQYLKDWHPKFGARIGTLLQIKRRKLSDPYRLLSAHMHGQNELSIPNIVSPTDALAKPEILAEVPLIQVECCEYLSDILWAVFGDHWRAVPTDLMSDLDGRFVTKAQKADFFK
jgi:hypothetical protein